MPAALSGTLFTMVAVMAIGVALRRTGRLPADASRVCNRIVLDVTLPALVLGILWRAALDVGIARAILANAVGQLVALSSAVALTRALGLPRRTQGAAGLTTMFGNTAFFGIPLTVSLLGAGGLGASTAVLVDAMNTTVLMWTVGLLFARKMASAPTGPIPRLWSSLVTPLTICVALGLTLNLAHVPAPAIAQVFLERVGAATTAIVFLSLGLRLDLDAVRGRVRAVLAVSSIKLALLPLAALVVVRLVHLHGPVAQVAVQQAAMPTAMISVVLATETGCDGAFASGVAITTTLLSALTLPIVIAFASRL